MNNPAPPNPVISLRGINKTFGQVKANQDINLDVYPAEILALLGENGAGKSTLMKILYGFYRPDYGEIRKDGVPVEILSPADARMHQIGMVFQNFNQIPAFSVAENIALFDPDTGSTLDLQEISDRIRELSSRYNLQVNPNALVGDLSIGEQQKIEILKLLISHSRILILDEPTRVLAPHEISGLFEILNRLKRDGFAIILITHKLREVMEIADRVTVLRKGQVAGSVPIEETTETKLIELMFGRKLQEFNSREKSHPDSTRSPRLEIRDLTTEPVGSQVALHEISLAIQPHEIVGVAGVSGNGQRELADAILGRLPISSGDVILNGSSIAHESIRTIRKLGVVFIPENPLLMAVAPMMSVLENAAIPQIWRYTRFGGLQLDWASASADFSASLERLDFSLPFNAPARSLSGGNLQRLIIAREMAHQPQLVIASYITSGLDVRSAIAAREALSTTSESGAGVLFFSDDLDELLTLCHRLVVLQGGRIRGEFSPDETDIEEIGYLMTGTEATHD